MDRDAQDIDGASKSLVKGNSMGLVWLLLNDVKWCYWIPNDTINTLELLLNKIYIALNNFDFVGNVVLQTKKMAVFSQWKRRNIPIED